MKKVIIFDFDGVIVNTLDIVYSIHSGRNPGLTREKYLSYLYGNDFSIESTDNHQIRLDDEAFSMYEPKMLGTNIVEGMDRVIRNLAEKYILAIVSSSKNNLIKSYLSKYNLDKYFDIILGLEDGQSKIEKLQTVMKKYGVNSDNCLFVTDTLGDLTEGEKAGVKTIAVSWGFHDESILRQGKPLKLVFKPDEILEFVNTFLS